MKATSQKKYQPTEKAQAFLDTVENPKYDRGMIRGLNRFLGDKLSEEIHIILAQLYQEKFYLQAVYRISSRVRGAVVVSNVFMKADGKDGVRLNKLIHFLFYSNYHRQPIFGLNFLI